MGSALMEVTSEGVHNCNPVHKVAPSDCTCNYDNVSFGFSGVDLDILSYSLHHIVKLF